MTNNSTPITQALNTITDLQSTVATLSDQNCRLRWAISELLGMTDPDALPSDLRGAISDLI